MSSSITSSGRSLISSMFSQPITCARGRARRLPWGDLQMTCEHAAALGAFRGATCRGSCSPADHLRACCCV